MRRDERATHSAYKACLNELIIPLVGAYNGNMAKSTGDGFFAQFDSVVCAMECAVSIQESLPPFQSRNAILPALQFRLGVNSGDVIAEAEDIYGNDVNTAARLQEQAPPGAICITAGTYEQVHGKLTARFKDLGEITFKDETTPTRVFACYPDGYPLSAQSGLISHSSRLFQIYQRSGPARLLAISALTAIAVIAGTFFMKTAPTDNQVLALSLSTQESEKKRPSIAVLAFDDRSGSPETRALSLGMGDTIATALAASRRFFVIDPKSSLEYSSASPSVTNIARQLNVRFLLLGSVSQMGQKIRVNARLVDVETGRNHWAYSILEDVDKVFDIEDKISSEVITALSEGPNLAIGKGIKGGTRNIGAYRSFLKGWQILKVKPVTDPDTAIIHLEEAIQDDPNYGNAYAAIAAAYVEKSRYIFPNKLDHNLAELKEFALPDMWLARQEFIETAQKYLQAALTEPTAYAHRISAQINYFKNNHEAAAKDIRNAFVTDPNDADSAAEYGLSLIWNGETEAGVREIKKAIGINPRGKDAYRAYLGIANFTQQRYRTALVDLSSSLGARNSEEIAIVHMIAAYGHLAEIANAKSFMVMLNTVRKARGARPDYIQRILRNMPYKYQADRLHLAAGLHKAGMKYGIGDGVED